MNVTVLYFGGEEISVTRASEGVNGTYVIHGRGIRHYSGIINGEFVSPDELGEKIRACVQEAGSRLGDRIYVGVPSCFYTTVVYEVIRNFPKPIKLTEKHIEQLVAMPANYIPPAGYSVIQRRAVYYKVDDGRATVDIRGVSGKTVNAQISVFAVTDTFIRTVSESLYGSKFKKVVFLPVTLAEALYLIDLEVRDATCVLLSCGISTTSVSVICGDSLVAHTSVDIGFAHCVNDVSVTMKVGYSAAKDYVMNPNDKIKDITMARLEEIAEHIFADINALDKKLYKKPFYICGGYIDTLPNSVDLLSAALDVKIEQCPCPFTEENTPAVSRDAVIRLALRY